MYTTISGYHQTWTFVTSRGSKRFTGHHDLFTSMMKYKYYNVEFIANDEAAITTLMFKSDRCFAYVLESIYSTSVSTDICNVTDPLIAFLQLT